MYLTLGEIADAVGGRIADSTDKSVRISGVFTDSREAHIKRNRLFVAIKGSKTDAHIFVKEITSQGNFALVEDENYFTENTILVDSTTDSLQELAAWYRRDRLSGTKIIAVTGSVGKTSTKDMVALAVGAGLKTSKTQGNRNSQIGLPITILETETDRKVAVLEVGMSEPGEMTRLSRISRPDIAMITNIGYSHIEFLGSRENICLQKIAVADYMTENGVLILNGDEPLLKDINRPCRKIYCSVKENDSDCFASDITETDGITAFTAYILGNSVRVELSSLGKHNVFNALYALTAAALLGVNLEKAAEELKKFESSGLRQRVYAKDGYTIIADCYNASPESMEAALSVLGAQKGRRIAVLGDMLELGSFADELHEKVGELVIDNRIDILITFGTLAKSIAIPAIEKIQVYSFDQYEYDKAAELIKSILTAGDYILYKASNRMQLNKLIEMV